MSGIFLKPFSHLHIICPLNFVISYIISYNIITYCGWNFMKSCIVVFVHHIIYVACAPCEQKMMASLYLYVHILHKVLPHDICKFQTRRLCPVTTGWAYKSFRICLFGRAKPNVRSSRLNNRGGPVEVTTCTLYKWFMHHPAFDLVGYKCYLFI